MADGVSILAFVMAGIALILAIIALIVSFMKTGEQGPPGPTGGKGPTGQQGIPGPTGPVGPSGLSGPTGIQGIPGASGPTGASGLNGNTGPTGVSGPRGYTGSTGASGSNGVNGVLINMTSTNSTGSDGDTTIVLQGGNGVNYVFDAYNNHRRPNSIYIQFSASRFHIGDVFSITNRGRGIRLYLNPQRFSNLNTSGVDTDYKLDPHEINTALILITGGSTPYEKNINILFSTEKMETYCMDNK